MDVFELAYDRYSNMLFRLAISRVNNREEAEDVVQDVFLKYLAYYPKLKDEEHTRAWLVRVTINASNDSLRRMKRRTFVSFDTVAEIAADESVSPELRITMDQHSALPDKIRVVIILHYLEGYQVKEVASMLGISLSACKMRLARGRKMLGNIVAKEERNV